MGETTTWLDNQRLLAVLRDGRIRDLERETARLRDVVAQHERIAVTVAEQAINLFTGLVTDLSDPDDVTYARAKAVIEVDEGVRAVDQVRRYEAEERPARTDVPGAELEGERAAPGTRTPAEVAAPSPSPGAGPPCVEGGPHKPEAAS